MKKFLLPLSVLASQIAFSQNWPMKQAVTDRLNAGATFKTIPAFSFAANRSLADRGAYTELQLRADFITTILQQKPEALQLDLPLGGGQSLTCQLVKASLGNMKITENNGKVISNVNLPVLYRGVVAGEGQKNNVVLTVTEGYVSLMASFTGKGIQVAQADTANPLSYRLYNSEKVQFPVTQFSCGTKTEAKSNSLVPLDGSIARQIANRTTGVQDKCINVYVECFDSLYQHFGSNRQQTVNYVFELFNLAAAGFLNDSIKVQVIGINVWTTTDPYRQPSRDQALDDLCFYQKDNFWGNLCVGLDWGTQRRSGKAGKIGGVKAVTPNTCGVYTDSDSTGACCYCDLNYSVSVQNFPTGSSTTQQQVYITMHEMGHLLGAHHTKWCGWLLSSNPTTYGTLDSCGAIEGSCSIGPPPPAGGATIMSYCVNGTSTNDFVNYNNGFGLLPGNAIRSYVSTNSCIAACLTCTTALPFMSDPARDVATTVPWRRGYLQPAKVIATVSPE